MAAQAGQKIYTITAQVYQANPNIVNNQLSAHSQSTKDRIQQALDAGYEITIHEAPITQDGWTGAGFSVIDPNTGAGGYLIEGGSNGGFLAFLDNNAGIISLGAAILGAVTTPLTLPWFLALTIATAVVAAGLVRYIDALDENCFGNISIYVAIEVTALVLGIKVTGFIGVFFAWIIGFLGDGTVRGSTERGSTKGRC